MGKQEPNEDAFELLLDGKQPIVVRYDFLDKINGQAFEGRTLLRVSFWCARVEDDCALLGRAGFKNVKVLGDWDGRPFDRKNRQANERAIFVARSS